MSVPSPSLIARLDRSAKVTRDAGSSRIAWALMSGALPDDQSHGAAGLADLAAIRSRLTCWIQGKSGRWEDEVQFVAHERVIKDDDGRWVQRRTPRNGWRDLEDPLWWLDGFHRWARDALLVENTEASTTLECNLDLRVATGDDRGLAWPGRHKRLGLGRRRMERIPTLRARIALDGDDRVVQFAHHYPEVYEREALWAVVTLTEFGISIAPETFSK